MAIITEKALPSLPPPAHTVGFKAWAKQNLFATPTNSVITVLMVLFILWALIPVVQWAFIDADWAGTKRTDCTSGGACWAFTLVRFNQFIYGFYPEAEQWRVNVAALILAVGLGLLMYKKTPAKAYIGLFMVIIYPVIAFILLRGGFFDLPVVETSKWGGLTLTLVLSIVGIVASLPLGILLALGRRSELPIIRSLCIAFIELWRGVPLITVLFMASVMLPLFLPEGTSFDKLLRALIGITLFEAAYLAEVVRSGLQAIPKGQYEAGKALGLSYWQSTGLVILPQALKLVIPGIVNTFISLFKDTSLVMIIGLFDLLNIVQIAAADPIWLGSQVEGFVFAAIVYWMFCFGMSRYSQYLERQLNTGHKR
ncbi:amino acid ABC transporter permease [Thiofilum flexile]|uniref:amino acid ABC transporter permease n=1 Tax=Thiofilum flexile TaxID=125627 RepID=UPI000382F250|nr:amino acid ABC transporter permease [Thiofilum flexile]